MDIELSSLAALLLANALIILCIVFFLAFFYKWDNKTYDDLVIDYGVGAGNGQFNDFGDQASQIESLLNKQDIPPQYTLINGQGGMVPKIHNRKELDLDLTSIPSRQGAGSIYSHKNSNLTYDRSQSLLQFGATYKHGGAQPSGMSIRTRFFIVLNTIIKIVFIDVNTLYSRNDGWLFEQGGYCS